MIKVFISIAILMLFASSFAAAGENGIDTLYLKSGTVLKGRAIDDDEFFIVELKNGKVKISKEDVAKAELSVKTMLENEDLREQRRLAAEKEFDEKLKALPQNDVTALLELSQWCGKKHLDTQRIECLKKVIAADPDNEAARKALGYVRVDGKWIAEEDYMKSQGFEKFEGRWLKPGEIEDIKKTREAEKKQKAYYVQLQKEAGKAVQSIASPDPKKREKGLAVLVKLAKDNNIPDVENQANELKQYYDSYWERIAIEQPSVTMETNISFISNTRLRNVNILPGGFTIIQLPTIENFNYAGTVKVPAGGGR